MARFTSALKVTDAVRPGVVSTLKGAWFRTSDNGQTVSALCPGHHADIAGGACYNDTRVEVAAPPARSALIRGRHGSFRHLAPMPYP